MLTTLGVLLALAPPPPPPPCNRTATVLTQISPDYPDSARKLGITLQTVEVLVYVAPSGHATAARVVSRGGNDDLNQAAKLAAMQSTYLPRLKNCRPTAGTYVFRVTFSGNTS